MAEDVPPGAVLPAPVRDFLDGEDLAAKVGTTVLLVAAEPAGPPRVAQLSVGEVVAVGQTELRLALYPGGRTTAALRATARALLLLVLDGSTWRIEVGTEPLAGDTRLALFTARVRSVEDDRVPYATTTSGFTYALADPGEVVRRWRRQVQQMREATHGG